MNTQKFTVKFTVKFTKSVFSDSYEHSFTNEKDAKDRAKQLANKGYKVLLIMPDGSDRQYYK